MRHIPVAALLITLLAASAQAETIRPVKQAPLIAALAHGREIVLGPQGGEVALSLRLYEVPVFEGDRGCVAETEATCQNRYLLAVSEFGEYPACAAYDLGVMGEVIGQDLLPGPDDATVRLNLLVLSLPSTVLLRTGKPVRAEVRRYLVSLEEVQRLPDQAGPD